MKTDPPQAKNEDEQRDTIPSPPPDDCDSGMWQADASGQGSATEVVD